MTSIRPQICKRWHATRSLLRTPPTAARVPLRSIHQQAAKTSPCTIGKAPLRSTSAQANRLSRYPLQSTCTSPAKHSVNWTGSQAGYSTATMATGKPIIHNVFESKTGTWQYVVADPTTSTAVIIDPVLDYDPATQVITTDSADALLSLVKEEGYKIDRILETHAHADHLTAASYLQKRLAEEQGHRPPIGIGKRIGQVQKLFGQRYGIPAEEYEGVFDKLFDDDETFKIGHLTAKAIHLPGHTLDHMGYRIGGMMPAHLLTRHNG